MSDSILPLLVLDALALLALGVGVRPASRPISGFLVTLVSGFGAVLCLPPLLLRADVASLSLPLGPPALALRLALDPLSLFFLFVVFLGGTAVAAFQATALPAETPRTLAISLGGAVFSLLAADAVVMSLGLACLCAAMWPPTKGRSPRLLLPFLMLATVALLSPAPPSTAPPSTAQVLPAFAAIRAAAVASGSAAAATPGSAAMAALLALITVLALGWPRSGQRDWTRDALTAALLLPLCIYLLLRVLFDLESPSDAALWGYALILLGGAGAVLCHWRANEAADLDTAIAALLRGQVSLSAAAVGLALITRAADLGTATELALDSAFVTMLAIVLGGTLTTLSAHAFGGGAGTYRLSRLGGLVHTMPGTAIAMAAGLFVLAPVPPSLGFAALWLAVEAILAGPRTGGLLTQVPLALLAGALALSAALACAASLRITGIAILGRPRTPRSAGARESRSPARGLLLLLALIGSIAGLLPGPLLWLLAARAAHPIAGPAASFDLLAIAGASNGYAALPLLLLLAAALLGVRVLARKPTGQARVAEPWLDGMPAPLGLPFGEPEAQSAGHGFAPPAPAGLMARLPRWRQHLPVPANATGRRPMVRPRLTAAGGLWLVLVGFAVLLLILAVPA